MSYGSPDKPILISSVDINEVSRQFEDLKIHSSARDDEVGLTVFYILENKLKFSFRWTENTGS